MVEAITARLNQVKSGRKEVQRQRTEDALLKILPVLKDGFEVTECPEMTVACFAISLVLAGKAELEDRVVDALMKAIAPFVIHGETNAKSALACVSILVAKKEDKRVPKEVLDIFVKATERQLDFEEAHRQVSLSALSEALVTSALSSLKQKSMGARFSLLEKVFAFARTLLEPATKSRLVATVLKKLIPKDSSTRADPAVRGQMVRLLQSLNDSADYSSCFADAASLAECSQSDIESMLGSTLQSPPEFAHIESTATEFDGTEDDPSNNWDAVESMLASLPSEASELSFLTQVHSSLFDQLAQAFTICRKSEEFLARFEELHVWRQKSENPTDLHTSFLLRIALGKFAAPDRNAALQLLSTSLEKGSRHHTHLLLPYISVFLSDNAQSVRTAAVACVIAIRKCVSNEVPNGDQTDTIYDALSLTNVKPLAPAQVLKLLDQVFLLHMEECILDPSQMQKVLQGTFVGHRRLSSAKTAEPELNKTLKHTLFDLLTGCALRSHLVKVKVCIVALLDGVEKVGSSTTSKTLSPILENWSTRSDVESEAAVSAEGLSLAQVDASVVQLITAQDNDTLEHILAMLAEGKLQPRRALVSAFFDRIANIWDSLLPETQISASTRLFDMCLSETPSHASGAQGVLHAISPSTEILAAILDQSLYGLAQLPADAPPRKRRRLSQGRESIPKDVAAGLEINEARLTFALELVENSNPESHPQLLAGMFDALVLLRRLKETSTSESPYLLNLCLSNILAIVDKARRSRNLDVDTSSIRADLVTNCVRPSENPQVQSTALLLSAALASIAPDRILHTIMPIFTFMGNTILSKDDERSIYVTNRAIDEIIPPLVASLKKQDEKNLIHSTSNLLSSFVTAYVHVPQHRRLAFYQRLLTRLGADDFSFAVIALLTYKRQLEPVSQFINSLMSEFSAPTLIRSFRKLIELVLDIFSDVPHNAEPLLEVTRMTPIKEKDERATILLDMASRLLEPSSLKTAIASLPKSNDDETAAFWTEFETTVSQLLAMLRSERENHPSLMPATRACLSALLELPSLADLFALMPHFLQRLAGSEESRDLQPLALRVLAAQLQNQTTTTKDKKAQVQAISFLAELEQIIRNSGDEASRQAAIECLDHIVELYGRKDPDAVIGALSCLIEDGNHALESKVRKTQLMSLLCLTTSMEVLKEAGLPIVLGSISKLLTILSSSTLSGGSVDLHDACYTLLSTFVAHVPFMFSDENLTEIFEISYTSCELMREKNASCEEARLDTLRSMARKLSLDSLVGGVSGALHAVILDMFDPAAVVELMDIVSQAIEHDSKSTVVKSAEAISNLILQALSLRQFSSTDRTMAGNSEAGIEQVQNKINKLGIIFVYKLNDTTFRPIFEGWVDWVTKGDARNNATSETNTPSAQQWRRIAFFSFCNHFFSTLKSIVTNYASYILPLVNEMLQSAISLLKPTGEINLLDLYPINNLHLYKSTLTLLQTLTTHDADSFFTSPSHFHPLSTLLITQFSTLPTLLSSPFKTSTPAKTTRQTLTAQLTEAITSLATAVQDIPSHHHHLNHLLAQLRHSPNASTRLASINTQIALMQSEVGDEWIQNIVLGQSTSSLSTAEDMGGGTNVTSQGGAGETMIYVNEMLEDDDEEVELKVREWVRMVRERVGEDVFEV